MEEASTEKQVPQGEISNQEVKVKWDYTSREQTLFIGALVVGLNLLVLLAYILFQTVPAVHSFFSGQPI